MNIIKQLYISVSRFRHRHGFGIHHPFVFNFITNTVYGEAHYYAYEELEKLRRKSSVCLPYYSFRVDKMLFRFVNYFQPGTVVEVGTGSGLSIYSMAAAKKNTRFVTGDVELHEKVVNLFCDSAIEYCMMTDGVKVFLQTFSTIDLLHIAHTQDYKIAFEEALLHISPNSLIVIEGIHESKAKQTWWKQIVADCRTGVTYDLYDMGLVFFDKSCPKQNYVA